MYGWQMLSAVQCRPFHNVSTRSTILFWLIALPTLPGLFVKTVRQIPKFLASKTFSKMRASKLLACTIVNEHVHPSRNNYFNNHIARNSPLGPHQSTRMRKNGLQCHHVINSDLSSFHIESNCKRDTAGQVVPYGGFVSEIFQGVIILFFFIKIRMSLHHSEIQAERYQD